MTTYSATTDAGLVADGYYSINANFSLTKDTTHLTNTSAVFTTANAGDYIMVPNCGGAYDPIYHTGPQGGTPFFTTIASVDSDKKGVVLNAAPANPLPVPTLETVPLAVCWGHTNNATALAAFNTAHSGETGAVLNFPSNGIFLVNSGNFGGLFGTQGAGGNSPGFKSITVNGNNSTICGSSFSLGSGGQQLFVANKDAYVASAYKGATQVTCLIAAEAANFTVGQWGCLTGCDLQFAGYPSNHQFYEYVLISGVNAGTGVVSFATTPLKYNYLSTWPSFDATSINPRYGGAAMLYAQDSMHDHTAVINDLTIVHHAQWPMNGRDITLNNVTALGNYGPYCTMSQRVKMNRCTGIDCNMEVDKYTEDFEMNDCDWGALSFQSSCPRRCTLRNTNIRYSVTGAPYDMFIDGCTIGQTSGIGTLSIGTVYGHSRYLKVYNSYVQNWGGGTHESHVRLSSVLNANTGFDKDTGVTMVNGMITVPKGFYGGGSSGGNGEFEKWPHVGAKMMWLDYNGGRTLGPTFTITNVTQDSNNTYIFTDWTGNNGGFPARTYGAQGLQMYRLAGLETTIRNCTGCTEIIDLSGAPAGKPLDTYTNRSYNGSVATGPYWPMKGRIKKIVVTVPSAWTTPSAATFTVLYGGLYAKMSDQQDYTWGTLTVDLKTAGTRSLITDNTLNWTGVVGADSLPNLAQQTWVSALYPGIFLVDLSSRPSGERPAFTVEIETDQNVFPYEVNHLGTRLHA